MTKKKAQSCEIVCVIDRSGSMAPLREDAVGGLNTFFEEQKRVPGKAVVTVILFDHEYIVFHDGVPLEDVKPFDHSIYVPRGTTALLDAMGRGISTAKERIEKLSKAKKPDKVIVAVLTDGFENASSEYNREMITKLINEQRDKESWEFIFLSADQSAIQDAHTWGFKKADTILFAHTGAGVRDSYTSMSKLTSDYRTGNN